MSGRLPMRSSEPSFAACCGELVSRSAARACAGSSGVRPRPAARPARTRARRRPSARRPRCPRRRPCTRRPRPRRAAPRRRRRRARRSWRRRAPSPGRRARRPSWRSAGASGRGRGGRRAGAPAPTRIEPESRPSRRNGFGPVGAEAGAGAGVDGIVEVLGAVAGRLDDDHAAAGGVLDRGQVVGPVAHREVAVLAVALLLRARAGALHLDEQDVAGPQHVRGAGERAGAAAALLGLVGDRAHRGVGADAVDPALVVDAEQHPEHVVPWLRRATSPSGARRRARRGGRGPDG